MATARAAVSRAASAKRRLSRDPGLPRVEGRALVRTPNPRGRAAAGGESPPLSSSQTVHSLAGTKSPRVATSMSRVRAGRPVTGALRRPRTHSAS